MRFILTSKAVLCLGERERARWKGGIEGEGEKQNNSKPLFGGTIQYRFWILAKVICRRYQSQEIGIAYLIILRNLKRQTFLKISCILG